MSSIKQFAIIGLGSLGRAMLEELLTRKVNVILLDKDEECIELYKNRVLAAYVADAMNISTLGQIIPPRIDGCVVDMGDNLEAGILVTHYLKKLGHHDIMVRGKNAGQGEILRLVGASSVVFPDQEAARRLVPRLVNNGLISYTPLGRGLSFAEIPLPVELIGKRVREAQFRERFNLNIIAVRDAETGDPITREGSEAGEPAVGDPGRAGGRRTEKSEESSAAKNENLSGDLDPVAMEGSNYRTLGADHIFTANEILLVSGDEDSIVAYAARHSEDSTKKEKGFFLRLLKKR